MDLEEEAPEIIMIKIAEMIMIVFIVFIKDIRRR